MRRSTPNVQNARGLFVHGRDRVSRGFEHPDSVGGERGLPSAASEGRLSSAVYAPRRAVGARIARRRWRPNRRRRDTSRRTRVRRARRSPSRPNDGRRRVGDAPSARTPSRGRLDDANVTAARIRRRARPARVRVLRRRRRRVAECRFRALYRREFGRGSALAAAENARTRAIRTVVGSNPTRKKKTRNRELASAALRRHLGDARGVRSIEAEHANATLVRDRGDDRTRVEDRLRRWGDARRQRATPCLRREGGGVRRELSRARRVPTARVFRKRRCTSRCEKSSARGEEVRREVRRYGGCFKNGDFLFRTLRSTRRGSAGPTTSATAAATASRARSATASGPSGVEVAALSVSETLRGDGSPPRDRPRARRSTRRRSGRCPTRLRPRWRPTAAGHPRRRNRPRAGRLPASPTARRRASILAGGGRPRGGRRRRAPEGRVGGTRGRTFGVDAAKMRAGDEGARTAAMGSARRPTQRRSGRARGPRRRPPAPGRGGALRRGRDRPRWRARANRRSRRRRRSSSSSTPPWGGVGEQRAASSTPPRRVAARRAFGARGLRRRTSRRSTWR